MTCIPVRDSVVARSTRWTVAPDEHFLTVCASGGGAGLVTPQLHSEIYAAAHLLALDHHWHLRAATVLPEHLHLLVGLGAQTTVAAVVGRFKERLESSLAKVEMAWQEGYCDRRVQPGEDHLPVFLFLLRHPLRASRGVLPEDWSGNYCAEEDWAWFAPLRRTACSFPPWLLHWPLYAVDPGARPRPKARV